MADRRTFLTQLAACTAACAGCDPGSPFFPVQPRPGEAPLGGNGGDGGDGGVVGPGGPDLVPPFTGDLGTCNRALPAAATQLGVEQVLTVGDQVLFVARDSRGFMAIEGICTHAGCRTPISLTWNAQAHTYDCSCHGSRFEIDGSVRQGPAVTPLRHRPLCRGPGGEFFFDPNQYLDGTGGRTQ